MMRRFWAMLVISIGVYLCLWIPQHPSIVSVGGQSRLSTMPTAQAQIEGPGQANDPGAEDSPPPDPAALVNAGLTAAASAERQALTARTAAEWDQVVMEWLNAIAHMHSVAANQPQRLYAQRKGAEYARSLIQAQTQASRLGMPTVFPTLGSAILDQQLASYLSYVAAVGVPDVLIVGSSRALWGVDPQALEQALGNAGYDGLRVYNLGVNGATAQVVNFFLQRLLTAEQLPGLIVWAGGSRGFNSARRDATFASVLNSLGYQSLEQGDRPSFELPNTRQLLQNAQPTLVALDANGFFAKVERFDPATYYQRFPRVLGRYDDTYVPFALDGEQTDALTDLANFTRSRNIPLVFINLPLTDDYLDATRGPIEQQFQQYLSQQSQSTGFGLIDYLNQWLTQYGYFADPSHLNRYGAEAMARQLAGDYRVPWGALRQQSLGAPKPAE